jgi:putative DNA primase/helicase
VADGLLRAPSGKRAGCIPGKRNTEGCGVSLNSALKSAAADADGPLGSEGIRDRIKQLATLDPLDYECRRQEEAAALNLRVRVLDEEVRKLHPATDDDQPDYFGELEPWPETVDGAGLLDDLLATIRRFCVLPEHSDILIAAWVLHAHAHDCADISPILCLTSPEKRCGKSTTASVVAALVPRPMHVINVSPAVVFRVIEAHKPTLIIDEGDTFLQDNGDMRGLLNGGHDRRTAYVWRSVGDDHEPRRFRVWGPKVLAMIGCPPDTIMDRSILVRLRRKRPEDQVERFSARLGDALAPLARKAARWVCDNRIRLSAADPDMPDELNDRAQDNARSICAIVDTAGGSWPRRLRAALVAVSRQEIEDDPASPGVLLLSDIAEILDRWKGVTISSHELLAELTADEEGPWAEWRRGDPITARGIAKLLKEFGIRPTRDRNGRFYRVADLRDACDRYLEAPPE